MAWRRRRQGPVEILGFDRPPDNHVRFADLRELAERLEAIAADESIAAVVLAGEVPGRFIGHADREDLMAAFAAGEGTAALALWRTVPAALEALPQPVVAALGGPATGGGSELALAATFRVGTAAASFTQHEVTRGLMPGGGATRRLPALIGRPRAARLLMSGETLDARRAAAWGVLDAVVDGEDAVAGALAWLEPLAGRSPAALRAIKRAMVEGATMPAPAAFALEQRLFAELMAGLAAAR
jgi:enoyl-CoA hydratase/carnithine racemase